MDARPDEDWTPYFPEDDVVGYAVTRFAFARYADVLDSILSDVDLDALSAAIEEYGLALVADQTLRALIDRGTLHGDEAAAAAEEDRIMAEDRDASPTVHPVTVADLADELTRLGLTESASSCG